MRRGRDPTGNYRPSAHQGAPGVEVVAALVLALNATDAVRQRRLGNLARYIQALLRHLCSKRRPETADRDPILAPVRIRKMGADAATPGRLRRLVR